MRSHDTTAALERLLAGAQRIAATTGDDDALLHVAQARLLTLRRCPPDSPRRGRVRLAVINGLVRAGWKLWDVAEALR